MAVLTIISSYSFFIGCKKDPVLPTVTTGTISQITENSASGSGEATADGGAEITLKGLCWSTTPDPTVLNMFMNATTTGIGSFNCNLIALTPNTQYYVRAFAMNEVGTAYGNTVTFTTLEAEIPDNIPVVSTQEVTEISSNNATCGGIVISDAGSTVTARGVCWSENTTPTITDNKTVNGTGAGSFTSDIAALTPGTTYYVRAYATNANGTGYGSAMSFTTEGLTIANLTTASITAITSNSAVTGGNITDDGNSPVTARGVCWSTSSNPTISDNHTSDGTGEGSYSSNISGLNCFTTYYVRAYATNSVGTSYGDVVSFATTSLNVGDNYQGGIIAYVFQDGDPGYVVGEFHGIIAAISDQGTAEWGCNDTFLSGEFGSALGKGYQNTINIINGCSASGIAAEVCVNYSHDGYDDWFLPSTDELYKLYLNRNELGIFSPTYYWSSEQVYEWSANMVNFNNGNSYDENKSNSYRVIPIRVF